MAQKKFKIKNSDSEKEAAREAKHRNRLNSIKNELEAGRINSFDQIFAIVSETRMSIELGISFYAFRRKIKDPGEFTVNEMMRLADLIGVKFDVISNFIWDRIRVRSKSRIFRE